MEWVSKMNCNGPENHNSKLVEYLYLKIDILKGIFSCNGRHDTALLHVQGKNREIPFKHLIMENSKLKLESNHSHPIYNALFLRRH